MRGIMWAEQGAKECMRSEEQVRAGAVGVGGGLPEDV